MRTKEKIFLKINEDQKKEKRTNAKKENENQN